MSGCKRTSCCRRGAVLVLAVILLPMVLFFVVFGVDIGYITTTHTELQIAADAAAMAGARSLQKSPQWARTKASELAAQNDAAGDPVVLKVDEDVEIGTWDVKTATFAKLTGADEVFGNAVRVTCRRTTQRGNGLSLFFAPLLGQGYADVSAAAVARIKPSTCGAFIGVEKVDISGGSYTDSYRSADGPYNPAAPGLKGHVCSDSDIQLSGGSYICGNAHPGEGYKVDMSSDSFVTGSTDPRTEALRMPPVVFGDAPTVNNNANIPLSDGGEQPVDAGKFVLSGGDHVDLPPGIYYFSEFELSGGSSVTVTGQTTIYTTKKFDVSGGAIVNTTSLPTKLQIYSTGNVTLSGSSKLYATVYAPAADVVRSGGSSDFFGMAVGRQLKLSGGGGCHADESLGRLQGMSGDIVLAQ